MSCGAVGDASSCRVVCAYSFIPLAEAASTGNGAAFCSSGQAFAFSVRYSPEITALSSPSSRASATGSTAAMSTGMTQRAPHPGLSAELAPVPSPLAVDQQTLASPDCASGPNGSAPGACCTPAGHTCVLFPPEVTSRVLSEVSSTGTRFGVT